MTQFQALFLDIDGTIIKPDHTIEDSTKKAIFSAQDKGIEVFLATGRPLHEIMDIAEMLQIQSLIGYNGAFAVYKKKELFKEPMKESSVEKFINIADENNHELVLYTRNKNYFTNLHTPKVINFIDTFLLKENELFTPKVMGDVLGITLMTNDEREAAYYTEEEGFHLTQVNVAGMHKCFDIIQENVNKGVGVNRVLDHLGIPKEHAIAFGDGMNDKEMLSYVGEGFAMGNSNPDLFAYAKHKTTEVTNSGVYNGLKSLGLVD
ncbi:Cof-type HAD-IIB family hydrolase [Bacillus massilinigeriensis]|uniref:Cof-type HAD-IIB family hydrolase n=1 Tax=Bacillus massilionigeriensis TaxID=1805475 RepID=UPI00096B15C2|nr:Cof-type HAD-IIB family hydrolase [Bacillus massilionigeriensis]